MQHWHHCGNLLCFKPLSRTNFDATYGFRRGSTSESFLQCYGIDTGHETSFTRNALYEGLTVYMTTFSGTNKSASHDAIFETGSAGSQEAFAKLGGILKTTEVNVTKSPSMDASSGISHEGRGRSLRCEDLIQRYCGVEFVYVSCV